MGTPDQGDNSQAAYRWDRENQNCGCPELIRGNTMPLAKVLLAEVPLAEVRRFAQDLLVDEDRRLQCRSKSHGITRPGVHLGNAAVGA